MLGFPVPFFQKPTHSSALAAWCLSSQRRQAVGVAKNVGGTPQSISPGPGPAIFRWTPYSTVAEGSMSKRDDDKMAKLIKKTANQVANKKKQARRKYDSTLQPETGNPENDEERRAFFSEMQKREF